VALRRCSRLTVRTYRLRTGVSLEVWRCGGGERGRWGEIRRERTREVMQVRGGGAGCGVNIAISRWRLCNASFCVGPSRFRHFGSVLRDRLVGVAVEFRRPATSADCQRAVRPGPRLPHWERWAFGLVSSPLCQVSHRAVLLVGGPRAAHRAEERLCVAVWGMVGWCLVRVAGGCEAGANASGGSLLGCR